MGLDMYLNRKVFIGEEYEHRGVETKCDLKVNGKPVKLGGPISVITLSGVYWRKFNALHNWFVENVQDGIDDCTPSLVTKDDIERLIKVLEGLMENYGDDDYASEYFPTTEGFFFGSTDYDEYYWEDVKETLEDLKGELEWYESMPSELYPEWEYQSSW
jgi:hypothetical protein